MTKGIFAKGVSAIVPVVGGVVAGGMTFATMRPMGMRMVNTFDEAKYDYTRSEFEADWCEVNSINPEEESEDALIAVKASTEQSASTEQKVDVVATIREYKALLDEGIITEEEFAALKVGLINSQKNM